MKRSVALAIAAVALVSCSSPAGSCARFTPSGVSPLSRLRPSGMKITGTYDVPSFGCVDIGPMVKGPDKRVWFTEFEGDAIGAISTSGVVSVYPTSAGSQPYAIAVRRKTVWAGGFGGELFRSTKKGTLASFPIAGAHIGDIVEGPDKNLWFTDYGNNKIGRVTKTGVVTEYPLPAGATPSGIAVGKDKNFWITDSGRNTIVKMSASGTVLKSYGRGITKNVSVQFIVAAPDGNLYFSQYADFNLPDAIGRITTKGKISEIGTLPVGAYPNRLTVGKDGNVYFAIGNMQAVGVVDLATEKVSYSWLPMTHLSGTDGIAAGSDKRLWLGGCYTIYAVSY